MGWGDRKMKGSEKAKYSFEEIVMGILLIGMSLILFGQILIRVFTGRALTWAEELARYFYVWSVFLSIGCTIANGTILKVDLLLNFFPAKVRNLIYVVLDTLNVALFGFLAYHAVSVVNRVELGHQLSPAMEIPMYIVYYIVPIGFAITSLRSLQQIYLRVTGKSGSSASPEKVTG